MKKVIFKLIVPLLGIIAMLGFITFFQPIKQQNAAWVVPHTQHYTCGGVVVYIDPTFESPSCTSGTNSSAASYQSGMRIWATGATSDYTIHYNWASFVCPTESSGPCLQHGTALGNTAHNLTQAFTAYSQVRSAISPFTGQACGYYQNDFGFYVQKNSTSQVFCSINLNNLGNTNNNASWCHTGRNCQAPTATPTVPVTPPTATPTVPQQIQHMACQQNACRLIPGPGANQCTQNSECEAPTATPTVTSTPTVTVTEQPTATPTQPSSCTDTNNCNNNNNNNNNEQSQSQTQNNNQSVNITLNGGQQQQQQVLAASTAPTQLPKTGAESDIIFGLLALIPVGWKLRKLV